MAKRNSNNSSDYSEEQIQELLRAIIDSARSKIQDILGSGRSQHNGADNNTSGLTGPSPNGIGFGVDTLPYTGSLGANTGNMSNSGNALYNTLSQLTKGTDFENSLLPLLLQFYDKGSGESEYEGQLFNAILQQIFTQDQRLYDKNVTQDQRMYDYNLLLDNRQYNSPFNQLARLLGAGISRDKAIELLSGAAGVGAGAGAGAGGSAVTGMPSSIGSMATPGTLSSHNAGMILDAFTKLTNAGVSAGTAYFQARMADNSAYFSNEQRAGYDAANEVATRFQDCLYSGNFTEGEIKECSNFDDFHQLALEKAKTIPQVAELVNSPAYQKVRGSMYGRKFFNGYWDSVRDSRNSGTILDEYIRSMQYGNKLKYYDGEKAYYGVQSAIKELSIQDAQYEKLMTDIDEGRVRVKIAGKELEIKANEAARSNTEQAVYDVVMNGNYGDNVPNTSSLGSGARMMAYSQWSNLNMQFAKAYAANGTTEKRDSWIKFFEDNNDAAKYCAYIKKAMAEIQSNAVDPEKSPHVSELISLYELLKLSGALDVIEVTADVATRFL